MARIDDIIASRRAHRFYDEQIWDFFLQIDGRRLENLSDDELQIRLARFDRNIQYLEEAPGDRDELPPERGWLSPWFWFRLRHWTLAEMRHRGVAPLPAIDVPAAPVMRSEFRGIHAGGSKQLVRISRREWMIEALENGRHRFAPASSYRLIEGDEARTDDEMTKAYRRPGRALTTTLQDGTPIVPIGDVTFSTSRMVGDMADIEMPYWLTSYSTELDPRLFSGFASGDGDDAALVIFDPMEFIKRSLPHLNRAAPSSLKKLHQIDYFDAFHPASERVAPLTMKDTRFAYQREWRMILDPEGNETLGGADGVLFVDVGSIADIAAVYTPDGTRIAGTGPDSFVDASADGH
ncbi:hypothetical protein [Sphingomonas sp. Leaf30]|jgi:hypothetical protein|uniref:hypothetical protein n=1 Tax=Sphingomonas sp. Leaf30 TaxID=1736213 RepID=UPI000AA1DA67|nr:hypothetical protein [Sphingomonas sp. Leaf30]